MPLRDPVLESLGKNVRKIREANDITQETLAELSELHPTYISWIERGKRNAGIKNVVCIAKALGVTASKLMEGVGE